MASGISKSGVSRICMDLDVEVAAFRDRSLGEVTFSYVFLDATYCKARVGHRVVICAVVIATGVTSEGHREVLGVDVGDSEDGAPWKVFVTGLKRRGLSAQFSDSRGITHGTQPRRGAQHPRTRPSSHQAVGDRAGPGATTWEPRAGRGALSSLAGHLNAQGGGDQRQRTLDSTYRTGPVISGSSIRLGVRCGGGEGASTRLGNHYLWLSPDRIPDRQVTSGGATRARGWVERSLIETALRIRTSVGGGAH